MVRAVVAVVLRVLTKACASSWQEKSDARRDHLVTSPPTEPSPGRSHPSVPPPHSSARAAPRRATAQAGVAHVVRVTRGANEVGNGAASPSSPPRCTRTLRDARGSWSRNRRESARHPRRRAVPSRRAASCDRRRAVIGIQKGWRHAVRAPLPFLRNNARPPPARSARQLERSCNGHATVM